MIPKEDDFSESGVAAMLKESEENSVPTFYDEALLDPDRNKGANLGSEFVAGVKSGVLQLKGTVEGATAIGAEMGVFGSEARDNSEFILKRAGETFAGASEIGPSTQWGDVKNVGDFANYASGLIGTFAPDMATSLGGGAAVSSGVKAAVRGALGSVVEGAIAKQVAGGLTRELAEAEVNKQITRSIADPIKRKALEDLSQRLAFGGSQIAYNTARESASIYSDVYEKTGIQDPEAALAYGTASGLLDSVTDIFFGEKLLNIAPDAGKVLARGFKAKAGAVGTGAAKGVAMEVPTEAAQEGLALQAEFAAKPRDWTSEDTDRLFEAGVGGGVLGGFLGGVSGGVDSFRGSPKTEEDKKWVELKAKVPAIKAKISTAKQADESLEEVQKETGAPTDATRSALLEKTKSMVLSDAADLESEADKIFKAAFSDEKPTQPSLVELGEGVSPTSTEGTGLAPTSEIPTRSEGVSPTSTGGTGLAPTSEIPTRSEGVSPTSTEGTGLTPTPKAEPKAEPTALPTTSILQGVPPTSVSVDAVKLSDDVKQFKGKSDPKTGTTYKLGGEFGQFRKLGVAPIVLWRRLGGALEVVTGRHRLDLARRSGEETISSQILNEADGYTAQDMLTLDAEMNIQDGNGEISDYANYYRNSDITREAAEKGGLLATEKGLSGFEIGKNASDDLYTAVRNGKISERKAAAIASAAPLDDGIQRSAMRRADRMVPNELVGYINDLKQNTSTSDAQLDMFGQGEASEEASQRRAKAAQSERGSLNERIASIKGAAKNPAAATREGLPVNDPEALLKRIGELEVESARYKEYWKHPDIQEKLNNELGYAKPAPVESEVESEVKAPRDSLFEESDMPFNLAGEEDTGPARQAVIEEETQADLDRIESEKNQTDMFGEDGREQAKVAMEEPAKAAIEEPASKISPSLASRLLALPSERRDFPFGNQNQKLRNDVLKALTGKAKVTVKESGAVAVQDALAKEFGGKENIIAGLQRVVDTAPRRSKTPVKGVDRGAAHFQRIKDAVSNMASLFPNRKIRVVKNETELPEGAVLANVDKAIGNISTALEILAKDEDSSVRYGVAENPNTPAKALELLAKDKTQSVVEAAEASLASRKERAELEGGNPAVQASIRPSGGTVEAYFNPSTNEHVFLSDNIPTVERAEQLFFHEATHGNIARLEMTPEGVADLDVIFENAREALDKEIPGILKEAGYTSLAELREDYGFDTTPEGSRLERGELLARFAERIADNPNPPVWWRKVLSDIKLWLAKHFGIQLSVKDIEQFLRNRMMDETGSIGAGEFWQGANIQPSKRTTQMIETQDEAKKLSNQELADVEERILGLPSDAKLDAVMEVVQDELAARSKVEERDGVLDFAWAGRAGRDFFGNIKSQIVEPLIRARLKKNELTIDGNAILDISGGVMLLADGTSVEVSEFIAKKQAIAVGEDTSTKPDTGTRPSILPSIEGAVYEDDMPSDLYDKAVYMARKKLLEPAIGTPDGVYKKGGLFGSGNLTPELRDAINTKNDFVASHLKKVEFIANAFQDTIKKAFPQGMTDEVKRHLNASLGGELQSLTPNQRKIAQVKAAGAFEIAQGKWLKENKPNIFQQVIGLPTQSQRNQFMSKKLNAFEFAKMNGVAKAAKKSAYDMALQSERMENYDKAKDGQREALNSLPPGVAEDLREMDAAIDSLMALGVKDNLVSDRLKLMFGNQPGLYLTRSFRAFDMPEWKYTVVKDKERMDSLAVWVQNSLLEVTARKILDQHVTEKAARNEAPTMTLSEAKVQAAGHPEVDLPNVVSIVQKVLNVKNEYEFGSIAKDLEYDLKELGLPEEVRAAWGEYLNPGVNFGKTVATIAQGIATERLMGQIREMGTREGWLKGEGETIPEGYSKIEPIGTYKMLNEFEGLYAPDEFVKFFNEYYDPVPLGFGMKLMTHLALVTTLAKTTLSVAGGARNFLGNVMISLISGDMFAGDFNQAKKGAWSSFRGKGKKAVRSYVENLVRLGVLSDNVGPKLIEDLMRTANVKSDEQLQKNLMDKLFDPKSFKDWATSPKDLAGSTLEWSGRWYGLMDEFWKVNAFESQKNKIRKYEDYKKSKDPEFVESTEAQLDSLAAVEVRKRYPTYSLKPEFVRTLKKWPMLGQFATFTAEMARTAINIVKSELSDAMSKDPYLKTRGMVGLARIAAVASSPLAAGMASAMVMGISGEEEDAIRESLPDYQKDNQLMWLPNDSNGNRRFWDMSYLDPYTYFKAPLLAAINTLNGNPKNIDDAALAGVWEIIAPFSGVDIGTQKLLEVYSNRKSSGARVYNPEDPDNWQDKLGHIWKGVQPGTITTAQNLYEGFTAQNGKEGIPEVIGAFGFKSQVSDPVRTFGFSTWKASSRIRDANSILLKAANAGGDVVAAYESAQAARKEILTDMYVQYRGALVRGVPMEEIESILKNANMSQDAIDQIKNGRVDPYMPTKQTMKELPENTRMQIESLANSYAPEFIVP